MSNSGTGSRTGGTGVSGRRLRDVPRNARVLLAAILGVYFCWPLVGAEPLDLLMRAVVSPGFVVTGLAMSRQAHQEAVCPLRRAGGGLRRGRA